MKKSVILSALMILSSTCFCQSKDTSAPAAKAPVHQSPKVVAKRQFFLVVTEDELGDLYSVIRTSGKFKGNELEDFITLLNSRVQLIPSVADTAIKKK